MVPRTNTWIASFSVKRCHLTYASRLVYRLVCAGAQTFYLILFAMTIIVCFRISFLILILLIVGVVYVTTIYWVDARPSTYICWQGGKLWVSVLDAHLVELCDRALEVLFREVRDDVPYLPE